MPRPRRPLLDPLLTDVVAAIAAGKVHAAVIEDEDDPGQVSAYGCVVPEPGGQAMYIDEAITLVDVLVHEGIHMARPEWSEQAVKAHTTRLVSRMTRGDIDRLYALYLSRRRVRKRRKII